MANAKRDEQKQKVMKQRCKKHLMKEEKRMFFMRDIFLRKKTPKKTEDFFGKYKRDKTNNRSLCSQKNAWIEWKRMEKEKNPSRKFLRRRMVRCPHQFVKKTTFFSARHNRIVKKKM